MIGLTNKSIAPYLAIGNINLIILNQIQSMQSAALIHVQF